MQCHDARFLYRSLYQTMGQSTREPVIAQIGSEAGRYDYIIVTSPAGTRSASPAVDLLKVARLVPEWRNMRRTRDWGGIGGGFGSPIRHCAPLAWLCCSSISGRLDLGGMLD